MYKIFILVIGLYLLNSQSSAQVHQDWATRTDSVSANDIAVDKMGNVYVAGEINRGTSGFNLCLVKYDSAGDKQWMSEYNGLGNGLDYASAVALDTSGNIFVTGFSFRGPANTNDEIVTLKYNSYGDTLWVRHYNSPGTRIDRAFVLAVDSSGNAYVGGYINNISYGNVYGNDYITIKYSPDGIQLWAAQLHVGDGSVNALAVASNGDVYVTGIGLNLSSTGHECITAKYNSGGDSLWVARYNGPGGEADAKSIALDNERNVYITGSSVGADGYYDYATIKYNEAGVEQWVREFDGPVHEDDKAIGIVVDKDQNIYVTGAVGVEAGASYLKDFATVKYNSDGDSIWAKYYNGTGYSVDSPVDIAIDTSSNIYITGTSIGPWESGSSEDYATVKYNSNGDLLWEERYNAANLMDRPAAVTVDKSGNAYVTGISQDSYTSNGSVTIKYSQPLTPHAIGAGLPLSGKGSITTFGDTHLSFIGDVTLSDSVKVYYYLVPPVPGTLPNGIIWIGKYYWVVVNNGTIFVNGFMRIPAEDLYGVTAGGCGACLVWLKRDGPGDAWQNMGGLFEGTFENGFLISTIPFDSFSEFAIGSLDSVAVSVSGNPEPKTFNMAQNYPNPFNPSTTIQFRIPAFSFVNLKVYDVMGKEVATLVNEARPAGSYEVEFDGNALASGIYYYQIKAGNFLEIKKMLLLK